MFVSVRNRRQQCCWCGSTEHWPSKCIKRCVETDRVESVLGRTEALSTTQPRSNVSAFTSGQNTIRVEATEELARRKRYQRKTEKAQAEIERKKKRESREMENEAQDIVIERSKRGTNKSKMKRRHGLTNEDFGRNEFKQNEIVIKITGERPNAVRAIDIQIVLTAAQGQVVKGQKRGFRSQRVNNRHERYEENIGPIMGTPKKNKNKEETLKSILKNYFTKRMQ